MRSDEVKRSTRKGSTDLRNAEHRGCLPHLYLEQAVRLAHGQRTKQQVVHETEQGGAGANTKGERERDDSGKRRTLPQHAHGVAQVLRNRLDERHAPLLPVGLAEQLEAAECAKRFTARVLVRPAAAAVFVNEELQMRRQLLVELAVQPVASHDRATSRPEGAEPIAH